MRHKCLHRHALAALYRCLHYGAVSFRYRRFVARGAGLKLDAVELGIAVEREKNK